MPMRMRICFNLALKPKTLLEGEAFLRGRDGSMPVERSDDELERGSFSCGSESLNEDIKWSLSTSCPAMIGLARDQTLSDNGQSREDS